MNNITNIDLIIIKEKPALYNTYTSDNGKSIDYARTSIAIVRNPYIGGKLDFAVKPYFEDEYGDYSPVFSYQEDMMYEECRRIVGECKRIGNYIGAIKQMVKFQNEYDLFIFVADMHAITVPQDPETLSKNIKSLIPLYLACGIDPAKNTIFIQSKNEYHANVSWILKCLTSYGELGRMTQFKDKSHKNQNFSAGLLTYPVLMAADILLYDTDLVPTGQDQKQHVELAKNIAQKINNKFGALFTVPEPLIPEEGAKIMDLVNPMVKMSKSAVNPKGIIYILDDEKTIRKKIMSTATDSEMVIKFDFENKPGISNLINIYTSITGIPIAEIEKKYEGQTYGTFKKDLADLVVEALLSIQNRYYELLDSKELDKILDEGKEKTAKIAKEKYLALKQAVGLHR